MFLLLYILKSGLLIRSITQSLSWGIFELEEAAMVTTHNMLPANRKELMNNAKKRTSEWFAFIFLFIVLPF